MKVHVDVYFNIISKLGFLIYISWWRQIGDYLCSVLHLHYYDFFHISFIGAVLCDHHYLISFNLFLLNLTFHKTAYLSKRQKPYSYMILDKKNVCTHESILTFCPTPLICLTKQHHVHMTAVAASFDIIHPFSFVL